MTPKLIDDCFFLDKDRLHYSPAGHQMMAMRVLDALGVTHQLSAYPITARPPLTARERRAEHLEWTRSFLVPWIGTDRLRLQPDLY